MAGLIACHVLSENFFEIILSERVKKMKKRGVINQQLSNALAGLGHGDYFLLCDAGFPIPKEVERVDLALTFGIPNMDQCLKAILDEIVVQKVTIAKEMKDLNDEGYQFLKRVFKNQKLCEISQAELVKLADNAKFIVRSGELRCYSNILLEAASGVETFKNDFIIDPAQI